MFSISHQFQMPCKTCTKKRHVVLLSYVSCELPCVKSLNHTLLLLYAKWIFFVLKNVDKDVI